MCGLCVCGWGWGGAQAYVCRGLRLMSVMSRVPS